MMNSHPFTKRLAINLLLALSLLMLANPGYGKHKKPDEPPFQYVAGTEKISTPCAGKLEVLKEGFTFACPALTFSIPYSTITLMEYRPDVSTQVMNMKIPWTIKPQLIRMRTNKYFAVVSNDQGKLRAVVWEVNEDDMRPYFAEIELQSGKTVQEYRSYEEFGN